jgi:hypothetical protein
MSARSKFVLDVVMAAAFLTASNPPMTGPAVHEWLGVSFCAMTLAHLLFNWNWAVHVTRRLFGHAARGSRLNYVVDAWLFVALTATVLSGIMISRHLLPTFGAAAAPGPGWREIHSLGANALVGGMGVHLGLHWNWLASQVARLLGTQADRAPVEGATALGLNRIPVGLAPGGAAES